MRDGKERRETGCLVGEELFLFIDGWRCAKSFDSLIQNIRMNRLGYMGIHANRYAALLFFNHRMGRHRDNGQTVVSWLPAQNFGGLKTIHHRHLNIHQHKVVVILRVCIQHLYGFLAIHRDINLHLVAVQ